MGGRLPRAGAWLFIALAACPEPKPDPKAQADGLYLAATTEYLAGNFDQALASFEEVRKLNPRDPRLPAAMGEVYLRQRKLAEAQKEFEAAAAADPRRSTNWSRLGFIYVLRDEQEKAAPALEKAISLNPRDSDALEQLGELALKRGAVDDAVARFRSAAEAAPDEQKAELYLRAAGELSRRGRGGDALAVLEGAAKAGVRAPELQAELGEILVAQGRLEDAAGAYRLAAEKSKDDPTLWELVGELEKKLGRREQAEASFRKSLEVKERAVVHVALSRLCLERKDARCARTELDRALATASGEEERETVELAGLLAELGRRKDALALLRQLASEPGRARDTDLQLRVARLAREVKDPAAEREACGRVQSADAGVNRCP
ncbi:MAG: tetratricopeptide repeat protein [Myxococcales bacterium]|nr:tetratricopeptide repeat protein [Myxococcales bacterium]